MKAFNLINENIILPLSDLILGQNIKNDLVFLNKSQWFSKSQLETYQNEKLRILIQNAFDNVPFYKALLSDLKLKPNYFQTKYDLCNLPVLTKTTIKKEGIDRFTSKAIPENKMIKSSSSGSTGEPLFYYSTKEAYSMNIASSLRGWYWMGYRLGDRYIKLSQNPRKNLVKRLQDRISNNLYLATNPLIESNYEFILKKIKQYKPRILRCYPDPLLFIARYMKERPEFQIHLDAITTTGNTLFPETRIEIEAAFGCKIFDSYSCEGNSTVFECPTHTCYHSTEEYGITEILDGNGNPISKGIGRLISTDLWNLAHPFIRYDTQDLVEVDSVLCSCGREHLKILRIIGRDNDILEMESGRRFIVHNFTGFFQTDNAQIKRSIDQFQVVKTRIGTIAFRLVVNNNYDSSIGEYIHNFWSKELKTSVVVEIVENITIPDNGKHRFIINE